MYVYMRTVSDDGSYIQYVSRSDIHYLKTCSYNRHGMFLYPEKIQWNRIQMISVNRARVLITGIYCTFRFWKIDQFLIAVPTTSSRPSIEMVAFITVLNSSRAIIRGGGYNK